jgi:diguanylate cyclase (GGDEF)-like protein
MVRGEGLMHIVLADPSRTVQKAVARLLQERGHEVLGFADGAEALAALRNDDTIDVLITSTEPHGMSGFELCWECRLIATARRPIYILMMSASRDQSLVCEALDSGADDFIGKPPVPEELFARIRAGERLLCLERDLRRLASTDSLTGAFNRRAFFVEGSEAVQNARAGASLSVVMMDIDHFKSINDRYGHDCGDEALRSVARAAMSVQYPFGRLGGEEFALLLPGCGAEEAAALAERVRLLIAAIEVETGGAPLTMTCSFGVGEWKPDDSIDNLLKRADIALYEAKTGGRNRVVVAHDTVNLTSPPLDPESVVRREPRAAVLPLQAAAAELAILTVPESSPG